MSFRVQIFVLVMLVAATAIGATAWLTLNLTSRQVATALAEQNRHRAEIVAEIQDYGFRRGAWPGVNRLVSELSEQTHLHIQLQTENGLVLADSDTEANRTSGPVQGTAYRIQPVPEPEIEPVAEPFPVAKVIPADLFGPPPGENPAVRALRQAAQYRAGLVLVRCLHDTLGDPAALGQDHAPYVTAAQLTRSPTCLKKATGKVLGDRDWFAGYWQYYVRCSAVKGTPCIWSAFADTVSTSAAVPLQLYLGGRTKVEISDLGRPAVAGAAGLLVVALAGTAVIAQRISRPVRRLTDAARLVAEGRSDVRVPTGGGSELARLTRSFNAMAVAVERSEDRQRRLVADVAHEIRTPLSNLLGYLEGLSDGVVEPSREVFASLHEEALLQRRILDDLQVLADAEAGDLSYARTLIDLSDLATTSATAHRAVAAEAGVTLTVEAPSPVWVEGDQDRLRQVLGNLLTNAIRYTDRDGQVLVSAHLRGAEAMLTVRDNGVGIASGDVPRVFDRFWRADPARQRATGGSGLGLTIAHRIVTDHGGRIEVASLRHMGTAFTVQLTAAEPPPEP
ncbi:sensor histidine kinase [Actinoplanes subtropicus]|uniref:sensor histidine kinase n=1 Tax=Actinoplanes subtropicus TaxID=543632 RepID=UPI0004C2FD0E|nr:ATP-binding protein [Actinoplanes subtropicus]